MPQNAASDQVVHCLQTEVLKNMEYTERNLSHKITKIGIVGSEQQRRRPACISEQSDQSLRFLLIGK